ncbi:MAG TPA: hypothetical protein VNJ07_11095 [Chitinophagales bacterium]|nr:hypothetical protein [Chitinophagales bacterium]
MCNAVSSYSKFGNWGRMLSLNRSFAKRTFRMPGREMMPVLAALCLVVVTDAAMTGVVFNFRTV